MFRIAMIIGGVAVAALAVLAIVLAAQDQARWEQWCRDQGGRVDKDTQTSTGTGVGSNGQVTTVTTSSTTYYCLSESGGIIDIH